MSTAQRLRRLLAGSDGPGRRALPAGEFLHPAPLAAALLLVVNDHLLKGSGLAPAAVTGKLSDFAGLLFFPLLVTALADSALLVAARFGAPVDFSLRRTKLAAAALATGALFAAIKLSPAAADCFVAALGLVGMDAAVVVDPTDLIALPALGAAYWLGTREIARVPLGRLEVIERAFARRGGAVDVGAGLADVAECGGDRTAVEALAAAFAAHLRGGPAAPVEAALSRLRGGEITILRDPGKID